MKTTDHTEDLALLDLLLDSGKLTDEQLEAFADMRENLGLRDWYRLTDKQRAWARTIAERLELVVETANDWSARSPAEQERIRGRPVALPDVLKKLPLKPPGRGGGTREVE